MKRQTGRAKERERGERDAQRWKTIKIAVTKLYIVKYETRFDYRSRIEQKVG